MVVLSNVLQKILNWSVSCRGGATKAKNIQKSVMHQLQSCCFAYLNLLLFSRSHIAVLTVTA